MGIRDELKETYSSFTTGRMYFEWHLPIGKNKAVFDTANLV